MSACAAVLAIGVAMSIFGAILQRNRALLLECLQEPGSLTARTADQRTPLMLACQTGQVAFLDLLLTSGADISAEDIVRAPALLLLLLLHLPSSSRMQLLTLPS